MAATAGGSGASSALAIRRCPSALSSKAANAGFGNVAVFTLMRGGSLERRVHNDEVEGAVGDLEWEPMYTRSAAIGPAFSAASSIASKVGCSSSRSSDPTFTPWALASVGHRKQALAVERCLRIHPGQHGGGEVHGNREHVKTDESFLHHGRVQIHWVAAVDFVEQAEAGVCGGKQGAGPAREVTDSPPGERVRIGPITLAHWHRQPGEEGGGGGPSVEGGQKLPVGDQPLEDGAGQVMRAGDAVDDLAFRRCSIARLRTADGHRWSVERLRTRRAVWKMGQ